MNNDLPNQLAQRLSEPLPGPRAGSRFEPEPADLRHYRSPTDARQAAVLALLYRSGDRWFLPLTLRSQHLPDHPGQVSLPGGEVEPGETSDEAAVREFHEEVGGHAWDIRLLGRLSTLYVASSNFRVEPWVGIAQPSGPLAANPAEVELILEVPLDHLLDPANFGHHTRTQDDRRYHVPHFAWKSHHIWGATCMILGELVTLINDIPTRLPPSSKG